MELNNQQEEVQRIPTEKEKQEYRKKMKEQNELLKLQVDQWTYTYQIMYYKAAVANMEAELEDAKQMALKSMLEKEEATPVSEETPA